ncbi:MAG: hypothetical protein ABIS14_04745 [Sphingomonas sp.]
MHRATPRWMLASATMAMAAAPLFAQHKNGTAHEAERIASQPARDVGVVKTKIPAVLARAASAPYSLTSTQNCPQLTAGIQALDRALGPDFGESVPVSGTKAGQIAKIGGEALVDSVIPFRGLVREVSGAAAAQRRLQAATYAGLARRGFLRGIAHGRGCR